MPFARIAPVAAALHAVAVSVRAAAPPRPEATPMPSVEAVRTPQPIRVDGRLDDAAWQTVEPFTDFIQRDP